MLNKIFQIGFNRCATTSIYEYFKRNRVKSIHWGLGNIAKTMYHNNENNKPLLTGIDDYVMYSDMEAVIKDTDGVTRNIYAYKEYYKTLDKQYPGSRFILNIRKIDSWIESRKKHKTYLKDMLNIYGCNQDELIQMWRVHFQEHINDVLCYFKHRETDLIVYDIDTDNSEKLVNAFKGVLQLKPMPLPKLNRNVSKI